MLVYCMGIKAHEKTQDKPMSSKHLKFVKGNHEDDHVYIIEMNEVCSHFVKM